MLLKETIGRAVTVAGEAWFLDVETFWQKYFCQHLEFWHQALGGGGFVTVFHIEVVTTGKDGDRELVRVRFGDSASRSLRLSDFRVFRLGWKDQITSCPIVVACWRSGSWPVWCLCWQND